MRMNGRMSKINCNISKDEPELKDPPLFFPLYNKALLKALSAKCVFCLVIALLTFLPDVSAEIYKWVDENGRVHFGDKPSADDAVKVIIKKVPAKDVILEQHREKQRRLLDIYDEERKEKQQNQAKILAEIKKREAKCTKAKAYLEATINASYLYNKTDDAFNPRILTDAERAIATAKAEQHVKYWCQPGASRK